MCALQSDSAEFSTDTDVYISIAKCNVIIDRPSTGADPEFFFRRGGAGAPTLGEEVGCANI